MMKLWPHQQRGLDETIALIESGVKRICVTSPTGGGKSLLQARMVQWARERSWPTVIYSPRRLLTDQYVDMMVENRIPFGVRQATYDDELNLGADVQISSALTEKSRLKSRRWDSLHNAKLVLIDEAHIQKNNVCSKIFQQHLDEGAVLVGYTATPLGISQLYDELVVAGTNSELRKTGALLPCLCYDGGCVAIDEVKRHPVTGEFNQAELKRMGFVQQIYGSVIKTYREQNPEQKPSILFAPGVPESKWFVDRLNSEGIHAAHIDGEDIYRDGLESKKNRDAKEQLFQDLRDGKIKVLSSRFLLREGVNLPELYYAMLCCPIGSLASYIQTVGRVLRFHPGLEHVKLADHGANIRRHGSPNEDRDWKALWKYRDVDISRAREADVRKGATDPGTACPQCGMVWRKLPDNCACGYQLRKAFACPVCQHEHAIFPLDRKCEGCGADVGRIRKKRVIEKDGTLNYVPDEAFKVKRTQEVPGTQKLWDSIFWSAYKNRKQRTFGACWAWFCKQHWEKYRCAPPKSLLRMPVNELDWGRRVCDVPLGELRGMEQREMAR